MMEEKKICPLVQDLLPSMEDGLTSDGSNALIREHLTGCRECRGLYEKLHTPVEILPSAGEEIPVEQFVKKHRRHTLVRRILLIVVSVLLLAGGIGGFILYQHGPIPTKIHNQVLYGYMYTDDGTVGEPVEIHIDGELVRYPFYGDPILLFHGTFQFLGADSREVLDLTPYEHCITSHLRGDEDGFEKDLLVIMNERDPAEYTSYGYLWANGNLTEFYFEGVWETDIRIAAPARSLQEALEMADELKDD